MCIVAFFAVVGQSLCSFIPLDVYSILVMQQ